MRVRSERGASEAQKRCDADEKELETLKQNTARAEPRGRVMKFLMKITYSLKTNGHLHYC